MGDGGGIENDFEVSKFSLELMRPLPGTEPTKRDGLEANNDYYWTHIGRYTKNGSGI